MITALDYKEVEHMGQHLEAVPYNVSRQALYSPAELYDGFDPERDETFETCYDSVVYKHYLENGKHADSAQEALARSFESIKHINFDKMYYRRDIGFDLE